jgi:hypothetical protein
MRLHRWSVGALVLVVATVACKTPGNPAMTDAGGPPQDTGGAGLDAATDADGANADAAVDAGGAIPDAPPDAGNACNRVGFSELPWIATGPEPEAAIVGDLDGDHLPDLVITTQHVVSVLLGTGGGHFQPKVEYQVVVGSPVLADLDHDGKLDLIGITGDVTVRLGNGDGTFQDAVGHPIGALLSRVTAGDVDGDGALDLVVSTLGDGSVNVLFGRGDGTFGAVVRVASVAQHGAVTVADINGDGRPDLVMPILQSTVLTALLAHGDGTFERRDYPTRSAVTSLAVADISGDGLLDLVSSSSDDLDRELSVLLGNGDGSFGPHREYPGGTNLTEIIVADVNGDGKPDVIGAHDLDHHVTMTLGRGDGTFSITTGSFNALVGVSQGPLVVTDVSQDGVPDLIAVNRWNNNVSVELGTGDGQFRDLPPIAGPAPFYFLVDLVRDGKLDAVGPGAASSLEVQLGNGDTSFRAAVSYPTDETVMFATTADVNHDGKADVITWNKMFSATSVSRSVLLGNGDGTLQARLDQPIDPGLTAVAAVDVDRDGNADLVEAYGSPTGGGFVRVQLSNADGTFRAGGDYPTSGAPGPIATADLDGDGRADLAVIAGGNTVNVLLGNADGTFRHGVDYAAGPSAQLVSLADVNGDGKPDLLVHVTDGQWFSAVTVMHGVGDGTFAPGSSYPTSLFPGSMAVADVTGDGVPDLVLGPAFIDVVSVLPGDGAGGFQPQIVLAASNSDGSNTPEPRVVAAADVTGDGKPDIVVSGGPVLVAACQP